MQFRIWISLLAIALASGCATKARQQESPSTLDATPPSSPTTTSPSMNLPPASTKRLVLHMTGPDFVVQAKDWPAFQEEFRDNFAEYAKHAGIDFELQKGDARPAGPPEILVDVYVSDYRMVGIGSRVFFGVMTGNAFIIAKATFSGTDDGHVFGERLYNTSSTAWAGVFAKMTPQQVDQIGEKVFAELGAPPYK